MQSAAISSCIHIPRLGLLAANFSVSRALGLHVPRRGGEGRRREKEGRRGRTYQNLSAGLAFLSATNGGVTCGVATNLCKPYPSRMRTDPADAAQPMAYINGKRRSLPLGKAEMTLLQYLRGEGLTGTKLGCGEGGCGACTVMVSSWEGDRILHRAVNACLCPLYAVEGMHVITVEGIGNVRDGLHPVQERLANAHGSQCGFCTPGFVMSMYSLLRCKTQAPSEQEIEEALAGNLCRCTGYRPILDAFRVFAKADPSAYTEEAIAASKELNGHKKAAENGHSTPTHSLLQNLSNGHGRLSNGESNGKVCPSSGLPCDCGIAAADGEVKSDSTHKLSVGGSAVSRRPSAEPIFPAELKARVTPSLTLPGPLATWHRPTTLAGLLAVKAAHPDAKLVVGNTEVGIEMKFKHAGYAHLVGTTHVPELNEIEVGEDAIVVGAAVTLTRLDGALEQLIAALPAHRTRAFVALREQLKYFAGVQIRNAAALGGNIVTGSPISDINPLLMACRATFTVVGQDLPERQVAAEDFFLGYRKVDLAPSEVLLRVALPCTRPHEFVREFKQAHRRDDDIAIVNAGMRVRLSPAAAGGSVVEEVAIAYGGVAPKTIMATRVQAALLGKPWSEATLEAGLAAVAEDVNIAPNAPGGMVEFRRSLAASFLFRFFVDVALQLQAEAPGSAAVDWVTPAHASAAQRFHRPASMGMQYYGKAGETDVVGQPERHRAADLQVTGEALYTDDVPLPPGTLHAALVTSSRPHAKLLSVDASAALEMEGVAGFFDAASVPGSNDLGAIVRDEEVFASSVVTCIGQPIGVVAADTEAAARAAARAVRVQYQDLPAVLSIDEAIAAGSYYEGAGHTVECGDVDSAWGGCAHVVEGEVRLGGQEHFYLEPQGTLILPGENDEYTVISSTQGPMHNQMGVAKVLGIPGHKVVARTKRIGGGFGGKETRAINLSCAAAVPAYLLRRAVRLIQDRDEDMQTSGHRHPFLGRYKVGSDKEGRLRALEVHMFNNGGCSLDLSGSVMDRALLHIDCCYAIPNLRAVGHICRTNHASNTAFRGFGGPQGMMIAEMYMDHLARAIGKPLAELQALNFYSEGQATHFGQPLIGCQIQTCWDSAVRSAGGLTQRRAAVEAFNAGSRWRKRGLAVTPTKFGIAFTAKFLNQAGALVHVYTDGTVLVTHGGVEMGQGLHTKVAQVAAHALGLPLGAVYIAETATDKVPNASSTAASASSDLYGGAVADACAQLNERLAPYKARMPGAVFADIVEAAYMDRVDLSAHGFYITPGVTGFGGEAPFNYFCYGAAVSEVELDTLTGDFHLLRSDLCMDVGRSLNPAIDIGQVEGGFVQGLGWTCLEELVWGDAEHKWLPPGVLHTRGPGTYKIPTANDIPLDLRVTLLRDAPCARTPQVHSSKAVGEPPLFLGASVFFALKDAIYAARADAGLGSGYFRMDSPATPERLRMAAADEFTAPFAKATMLIRTSC